MSGILGSYSDSTCNTHNALRYIEGHACGATFSYRSSSSPPDMHYAVVSIQKCCDEYNATVLRIPGNIGCEMQFCNITQSSDDLYSCLSFVSESDLPDDIADKIANVGNWCTVRMYDDEVPLSEELSPVTASAAPPSWTEAAEAAANPFGHTPSSSSSSEDASTTSSPTSTSRGHTYWTMLSAMSIWTISLLMTFGLVVLM